MRFSRSVLSLAVVSTVLLAGCQSSGDGVAADPPADPPAGKESPAEQAADIEVVETGAATSRMFAVVRNNETRQVVAKIKFFPVDAAGKPVRAIGDSATVVLPPSSTIPVAMDVGLEVPAKVTVELKPSTAKVKTTGPGEFTGKKATLTGGSGAPWRVKTSFTNGYAEAMERNIVVLTCRDAADKVIVAVTPPTPRHLAKRSPRSTRSARRTRKWREHPRNARSSPGFPPATNDAQSGSLTFAAATPVSRHFDGNRWVARTN